MWKIAAETEMSPVAVDQLIALVPDVLRAWRELRFDDGVYRDDDGRLHKGLQVVAGTHPLPGARYRVALEATATAALSAAQRDELKALAPPPRASGGERRAALDRRSLRLRQMLEANAGQAVITRYEVEIREDSDERVVIVVVDEARGSTVEVSLDQPGAAGRLSVRAGGRATGRWPQKGKWTATAEVHLGELPPRDGVDPQCRGTFRHRHFRGDGHLGIHARSRWLVYFAGRVGGRGLMRPAVSLASVLFGSRVRGDLRRRLEEAPDFTADLQRQLDELPAPAPADADGVARADARGRAALRLLLDRVVEDPD